VTKEERLEREKLRLIEMKVFEAELYEQGVKLIAGIDEVGRGPLAGPVVAAAVILPEDFDVLGIDDSKKLSEKKRESLSVLIKEKALAYGIGIIDNQIIDEVNILEATKLAMKQAIETLDRKPEYILIDALTLKDVEIPQKGIIKGDSKSLSIAAASILAKVTRDKMMVEYHLQFPHYVFDQNKGYGTKAHYEGIRSHGICELHRKTFLKGIV